MIAAEQERVAGATPDRLHSVPIGLNARRAGIVERSAVNRAPEVRIELEIGATPLAAHRAKDLLEMRLRAGMRAVDRVPGAAAPSSERDLVGAKRIAVRVLDEPVRMLLKQMRACFGDERRDPDRGLKAAFPNLG